MTDELLIKKFRKLRLERSLTEEDLAKKLGVSVETIEEFEKGTLVPSLKFLEKAEEFFGFDVADTTSFESIFTQGYFGTKVPLLKPEDLIADSSNRVVYYFELPHLSKYGEDNLFALRYTGNNVTSKGILHDSIMVFVRCEKIDRDGVYVVIKRGCLTIKDATIINGEINTINLTSGRPFPSRAKSSIAAGRMVCCINNY